MKAGTEDKKKLWAAGVLGFLALLAVVYLYETVFGGPTTPAPQPVVVTTTATKTVGPTNQAVMTPPGNAAKGSAQRVASSGAALDPTLHMEAMLVTESLVYSGSGRNIFASGPVAAPVKVVQAKFPARPSSPPAMAASAPVNLGPPPPPPINLKFFGTATTAGGAKRAFLLNGDDVYLASVGDVVQRRYRVVSISTNAILVEDMPNSNRQSLPLMGN